MPGATTMNLQEHYQKAVIPALQEQFGYRNILATPKVVKIVANVGISSGTKDPKVLETAKETLRLITGQQPVERKAKKSISNFKIRQGQTVGLMVTLRGKRMYNFLEKMINFTFPRVRDFRGLTASSFDARGNFTIGLKEAVAFPEVKAGELERQHGLEVTIVTTAKKKEEGVRLLTLMGMPFRS